MFISMVISIATTEISKGGDFKCYFLYFDNGTISPEDDQGLLIEMLS